MKKINFILAAILLLPALSSSLSALECPKSNAPLCPESGSTLLDETYPTQAFIMSNSKSKGKSPPPSPEELMVTRKFINTIIKSYNFKDVPQIMLAVSTIEEFNATKLEIAADLKKQKLSVVQVKKILDQITHVKSQNYTWQQDYFQSFVNLQTGSADVRHIEPYYRMDREATSAIAGAGKACGVSEGSPLKADPTSFGGGEMGGNIEGAPGGFCLVGNNLGKEFTKSFCGKEENIINLNVSWLAVGHVDEIFKIVPNHINDGRPSECKFSLMAASPKKALDLLQEPSNRNRPYFDFGAKLAKKDLEGLVDSRSNVYNGTNKKLCVYMTRANQGRHNLQTPAPSQIHRKKLKVFFFDLLMNEVVAGIRQPLQEESPLKKDCKGSVTSVTNEEMSEQFLKDKENFQLNMAIQTSIDKDTALIKSRILSRLPQCAKYFDVINVPNYFEGGPLVVNQNGEMELPKNGNINAFLPNPTNSVLMNKTLLFSDAGNSTYNNFLSEEMKKRKVESEFIGTWDYSHLLKGNIHCSSNSLLYCSPRSKQ